eukprot:1185448-Prorocentrum_minimum.AAC.1
MMCDVAQIGDKEIALDDMWSLDLNKLNGFKCLKDLTTLPKEMMPEPSDSDESGDSEWEEAEGDDDM